MNTTALTVINISDALLPKIEKLKKSIIDLVSSDDYDATALGKISTELAKLETLRNRAKKSEAQSVQELASDIDDFDERAADFEVIKNHVRANVLAVSDYYYIHSEEKFLLFRNNKWSVQSDRSLRNHHTQLVQGSDYFRAFIDVLKEDDRWFYGRTSSFKDEPGMLNMLRPQILEPIEGDVHPIFNLLIRSICGDKAENIDHVEKVIIAKQQAPFQYLLPTICFSDKGGTGKSLFVSSIISTIFGASAVNANCKMADFAGQFNGHLAGKLAILVNENCEDSYNHNAIKQIAGSPTITFTNKNQMPYEGDNSALLFVTGNGVGGAIRVSGGDVDRRFSVMQGSANLETYVRIWLETQSDEKYDKESTKEWIVSTGQHILSDPVEVAKWLNYIIGRHGKIKFVQALHGADYRKIVSLQTSLWDQIFKTVFDDPSFSFIRKGLMFDFYRHECQLQGNRAALGKAKFYQLANDWCETNRPDISTTTANWDNTTADVFITNSALGTRSKPQLKCNDYYYYLPLENNRREWKVEL
jgi:hypothetical protein